MLAGSPSVDRDAWVLQDAEQFGEVVLEQTDSVESISALAQGVEKHGYAFSAWANLLGRERWSELDQFEARYQGQWESTGAYARMLIQFLGVDDAIERSVIESLRDYVRIDYELLAIDLQDNGDIVVVPDEFFGVQIFTPDS